MADHSEDTQTQLESVEETQADIRKRHDETFKRAREFLRKHFEDIARTTKGNKNV